MTGTHLVRLAVDGRDLAISAPTGAALIDILDEVGLPVPAGCRTGHCGSCMVLLDGDPTPACLTPAARADGAVVATVRTAGDPVLQEAMADGGAVQCGYCIPGMVVTLSAALKDEGALCEATVRDRLQGHLCRCTGYAAIVTAAASVRPAPGQ